MYYIWWGARAEKRDFMVKVFQKAHKNAFLACFLKKWLRRKKIIQSKVFIVIWESSENQFGRPKKSREKFPRKISNFSWKSAPLEKFLDPRLKRAITKTTPPSNGNEAHISFFSKNFINFCVSIEVLSELWRKLICHIIFVTRSEIYETGLYIAYIAGWFSGTTLKPP